MGFLFLVAGFPLGVILSWRQPSSASRGLLCASGAAGVFFWLLQVPGNDVPHQSVWMYSSCFLWGFAIGTVARYALVKERGGSAYGNVTPAELEAPEKRPRTKPVLLMQPIALVPAYWVACLAWMWLFKRRAEPSDAPSSDAIEVIEATEASVSFGESTTFTTLWFVAAVAGLVVAWTLRHRKGPPEWHQFIGSFGFKVFNPATTFGLLLCGFVLAFSPSHYFTRVKMDDDRVAWPQRYFVFWQTHEMRWKEISKISIYREKVGRGKYRDTFQDVLHFELKQRTDVEISMRDSSWIGARPELKRRAKRKGIPVVTQNGE